MKISRFTVIGPASQADNVTIVSTFSRTSCVMPESILTAIRKGDDAPEPHVAALKEMGVLVSASQEAEQHRLIALNEEREQTNTRELTLVVPLTSKCNLACSYCYQVTHGEFRGPDAAELTGWSTEGIEQLAQFAETLLATRGYECLKVRWYGGEPLLKTKLLAQISESLRKVALQHYAEYRSMIVTNGVLLSPTNIDILKQAYVERLEISLDGPAEHHNGLRPALNGRPTYDATLAGIEAVAEVFPCVVLRVNIHSKNVESIIPWLRELSSRQKVRNAFFKFKLVEGDVTNRLSWESYSQFCADYIKELKILGMKYLQSRLETETCPAIRTNYYIVQSDMRVYKCPQNLGSSDHVGTISSDGSFVVTDALELWESYRASIKRECNICAHLPHCHGGCPYNEIMTIKNKQSLQIYRREERCCRERVSTDFLFSRLL